MFPCGTQKCDQGHIHVFGVSQVRASQIAPGALCKDGQPVIVGTTRCSVRRMAVRAAPHRGSALVARGGQRGEPCCQSRCR
jgi:hypothetical protein